MNDKSSEQDQVITQLRTLWHPLVYRLHRVLLTPLNAQVEDEWDATEQPPKIDLILSHDGEQWTEEQQAALPDGIRNRRCKYHVLELKITESVTIRSFKQAITYDYLYPQRKGVKDDQFQTYIISSKTPRKKNLEAWGYKETNDPGVYISAKPLFDDIVLLVLNELRDLPHNNYFRLFASRQKVRISALESLLQTYGSHKTDDLTQEELVRVLWALAQAYGIEMEGVDMINEMTIDRLFEMGDTLRQSVIAAASPEERVIGLKPEERVMGLKPEERVMGLKPEERVMGLKPEEVFMMYRPEDRMIGLRPEERVIGLSLEEKRLLMEELQRSFTMDQAQPDHKH